MPVRSAMSVRSRLLVEAYFVNLRSAARHRPGAVRPARSHVRDQAGLAPDSSGGTSGPSGARSHAHRPRASDGAVATIVIDVPIAVVILSTVNKISHLQKEQSPLREGNA
jgi:hypothetical protein